MLRCWFGENSTTAQDKACRSSGYFETQSPRFFEFRPGPVAQSGQGERLLQTEAANRSLPRRPSAKHLSIGRRASRSGSRKPSFVSSGRNSSRVRKGACRLVAMTRLAHHPTGTPIGARRPCRHQRAQVTLPGGGELGNPRLVPTACHRAERPHVNAAHRATAGGHSTASFAQPSRRAKMSGGAPSSP